MRMEQDIRPVTWLKNRTREMLEQINETRRPIIVTQDGKPRAVIQDPRSYEQTKEALAMVRLLAMREREAEEGKLIPQDEVFAQVRRHIRKMRRRKTA